jgi:MFS family permease
MDTPKYKIRCILQRQDKLFWVFALSSAIYFTQGIETLPSQGLFYYLKESLRFSPEKIMVISSLITFAWLIKPVIGYVIDNFLNKRAWIFISLAFSTILATIVGLNHLSLSLLIGILIMSSAWSAFRDVAVDGIMCVEGKKHNATGKIQSVQWMSISAATLLTGIGGGYIAERWGYTIGFLCLIPIYVVAGIFAYFYNTEEPLRSETTTKFIQNLKTICGNKRLLLAGLFVFLYNYSPSFGTPLFFIQRDVFKWSKLLIGTLSTLGTVFAIIGALLYYKFSQKINIKKWLFFSVFLGAATTLSYLYYTPATAIAYDIIYNLMSMFIFLMILDFMARNSTPGLEAASFALLASLSNLALVASNLSGAYLLSIIGLQWLIVVSSVTSFLCLFLINKIVA